ncbi:hypothetical protein AB3N61_09030 [Leptospira sp. WS58.C1]|uniref:hypothetical protein n=1 Tax=Leptospira TaxID=171 RepID=UPI0002BFC198|nr:MULTISPECIES: hypothetical protein [unclassified Leptospira]EMK02081.1 hypothetical protein LEP1GSC192_1705 [Leptospira sp. B5-022]MCR1793804.1 hypothetical protein [Leptospira sp. id769339]
MPSKKNALLISSAFIIVVLIFIFTKSQTGATQSSSKNVFSEGFSMFSGFIGLGTSSSPYNEDNAVVSASLLKSETPDNLYWVAVATPQDAGEKKAQEELLEHWATLYGKIYSGKATRKEIDEYYTSQIKLQEDQLELLRLMEERYPERLDDEKRRMILAGKELYGTKLKNVTEEYKRQINK